MNSSYLMKYISYHLHTIIRRYTHSQELKDWFCARIHFQDEPVGTQIRVLFSSVLATSDTKDTPLLLSVNQQFVYTFIPAPDFDYIIGPIKFQAPVYVKYQVETDNMTEEWGKAVPVCDFTEVMNDILLVYNLHRKNTINEDMVLRLNCLDPDTDKEIQKHFSEMVFENREEGKIHNPYDQEQREFSSIENGDLDQLKQSIEEDYTGEIGTLAKNPLRNAKNLGIVIIALASRAAIRGGLLSEVAYSLSDSYIQKIELLNDIPSIFHLFRSAEFEYAQMVHDIRKQKAGLIKKRTNYHINQCKDYVFSHLHEQIYVQDIAGELGLNANYLSELFHRCENVTLTDFIILEKIKLVKNLLIYSHYSYSEIAAYLGFSSQSHLGKQFKKNTGMTLREYRETYGVKEFIIQE